MWSPSPECTAGCVIYTWQCSPGSDSHTIWGREVVDAERQCAEAREAVNASAISTHRQRALLGADRRGDMHRPVLTDFESPSRPQRARELSIIDDVPAGRAGCTPSTQHDAVAAAGLDGTPQLEEELVDCGRQLVDLERAWLMRDIEETGQYGGLPSERRTCWFPPGPWTR